MAAEQYGDDGVEPPPLPRISLVRIARTRRAIVDGAFDYYSLTLAGDLLVRFATYVRDRLGATVPFDPVYESCRVVAGETLTDAMLGDLAWRLAANVDRLKAGRAVLPWAGQAALEWVPVEVLAVAPGKNRRGKTVADCTLVSLAGSSASLRHRKRWTQAEYTFLSREFGYAGHHARPPLPFQSRDDLVGIRFMALMDPDRSTSSQPGFRQVRMTSTLLAGNLELIKVRARVDPCPEGYTHQCHKCSLGRESCRFATHPLDYHWTACDACASDSVPFDPAMSQDRCLTCEVKRRLNPQPK